MPIDFPGPFAGGIVVRTLVTHGSRLDVNTGDDVRTIDGNASGEIELDSPEGIAAGNASRQSVRLIRSEAMPGSGRPIRSEAMAGSGTLSDDAPIEFAGNAVQSQQCCLVAVKRACAPVLVYPMYIHCTCLSWII